MASIKLSRQNLSKAVHAVNTKLLQQFGMPRVKATVSFTAALMNFKPIERQVPYATKYTITENVCNPLC